MFFFTIEMRLPGRWVIHRATIMLIDARSACIIASLLHFVVRRAISILEFVCQTSTVKYIL